MLISPESLHVFGIISLQSLIVPIANILPILASFAKLIEVLLGNLFFTLAVSVNKNILLNIFKNKKNDFLN